MWIAVELSIESRAKRPLTTSARYPTLTDAEGYRYRTEMRRFGDASPCEPPLSDEAIAPNEKQRGFTMPFHVPVGARDLKVAFPLLTPDDQAPRRQREVIVTVATGHLVAR
jgi:hypothetical protein